MPLDLDAEAWNQKIIDNFRGNGGRVTIPPFVGSNLLILHTTGARSGEHRVAPLGYTRDGERYVVVGSNSGGPINSAWLHNLKANPDVTVEVGSESLLARATVTSGAERQRLWEQHVAAIPIFGDYERMTDREIPVIVVEPVAGG
jgi:deazaflavin-dependent oxidoreductase (nitroreductase family)